MQWQWQHAGYGWLAVLLPLLVLAGVLGYRWRRQVLPKIAAPGWDSKRLLGTATVSAGGWATVRYLLAAACMVGAILNPQRLATRLTAPAEAVRLLLVVDMSNSMYAQDVPPSRLENARRLALGLQQALPGSQLGIILFAGTAWLALPLTPDAAAARQVLQTMQPGTMPVQGTHLGAALQEAAEALQSVPLAPKAVLLLTDGEDLEQGALEGVQALMDRGAVLHAVGLGTPEGAQLMLPHEAGRLLTDEQDAPVVSRLDESTLQEICARTGGSYWPYTPDLAGPLAAALQQASLQPVADKRVVRYQSFGGLLALVALVLLLWPTILQLAGLLRSRAGSSAALLLLLGGLGASPIQAQAPASDTAALLSQAYTAWQAQDYATATEAYKQVLAQHPGHYLARFQTGLSLLQNQKWAEAATLFGQLGTQAAPPELEGAAWYNAGLAALRQGQYDAGIQALQKAQRLLPREAQVRANLQKALLEKPRNPPPPQQAPPPPPFDPQEAARKLEAIQEAEKKIRSQQKATGSGKPPTRDW